MAEFYFTPPSSPAYQHKKLVSNAIVPSDNAPSPMLDHNDPYFNDPDSIEIDPILLPQSTERL